MLVGEDLDSSVFLYAVGARASEEGDDDERSARGTHATTEYVVPRSMPICTKKMKYIF